MRRVYAPVRSRRSFLKVGAAALALIGVGGWLASRFADQGAVAVLDKAVHLDARSQAMLSKLADALLDGILPNDPASRIKVIQRVVATADQSIAALPPAIQKETKDLFGLLAMAPTRALLIGQWAGWANASREDVSHMLDGLRGSSVALRRAVYMGLRDLVASCFYASPETWPLVGYPGPLLRGPGAEV